MIVFKNTAYDAAGNVAQVIRGQAKLPEKGPKGRLLVSFGPAFPSEPNYCVLRVDKDYKIALVGSPDRNSLWILSRDVSVPKKRLEGLTALAQKSGYDTSKLIYAKWPESFRINGSKEPDAKKADLTGN